MLFGRGRDGVAAKAGSARAGLAQRPGYDGDVNDRADKGSPGRAREAAGAGAGAGAGPSDSLIRALSESILAEPRTRHLGDERLPSREAVGELVEALRRLMFPGFFGRRGLTREILPAHVGDLLKEILSRLEDQVRTVLRYMHDLGPQRERPLSSGEASQCEVKAHEAVERFAQSLPEIRRLLALDVQAAYDGDPAALHTDETIFCYPGIDAVFSHRIAHALYKLGVPLLPRIIQEMAHGRTGIDINPGATIGESFFIDHGGGVVIGETSVIGSHVRIYQGVTLGAKSIDRDAQGRVIRGTKRHPTIGSRVTIYAGAVILGGDTVVGDDCVVNGNTFVTMSVPPGHIVRSKQAELVLRSAKRTPGRSGGVAGDHSD